MSQHIDERTVTINQIKGLALNCFLETALDGTAIPKTPMVWGPPGIGKSEVMAQIAAESTHLQEEENARVEKENKKRLRENPDAELLTPNRIGLGRTSLIDIRLSLMEPSDIRGIPYFNSEENNMKWAPSEEFPTQEQADEWDTVLLFLDELSAAPSIVQSSIYQLILNRRVGTYVLPDNVMIVAAGNRVTDGSVSFKMPQALRNRMLHFTARADFDTWFEWAMKNGIHVDVISFLSSARSMLMKFDPKSKDHAWPSPRTWSFVSDHLHFAEKIGMNSDQLDEMIYGTVGEGPGNEFAAFRAIGKDLPKPSEILEGKVKKLKNKESSAAYFLVFNMAEYLQDLKPKMMDDLDTFHDYASNAFEFMMNNFEPDMTVMGIRTFLVTYRLGFNQQKLRCFPRMYKEFGGTIAKVISNK